jgi:HK97 family phage major capsid protein
MADDLTASEAKQLQVDLAKAWEQTKEVLDRQEAEIAKMGDAAADTKEHFDRLNTRLDEIETKMTRPGAQSGGDDRLDSEKAAFVDFLRNGPTPDNAKALSRGTGSAGGFLVPEGVARELVKNLVEVSDLRSIADVVTITEGDSFPYNTRTTEAAGSWVAENATRSETTNPAFGKGRIPVHEMSVMVDISRQLLDMAGFDVESEWMDEAVEACNKLEGAAFCEGNGVGRPQGLFHSLAGLQTDYTASGHASTLTADGLLAVPHDLKGGYLQNAMWIMERATLKAVRQLKDGNGAYLWSAGFGTALAQGAPATIDGYPYKITQDAPTIGANTFPIAFGDFKQGYKIVDHTKMHQIRDDMSQAASGNVRFWMTRYVGGQVVKAEAIRLLKIAAS